MSTKTTFKRIALVAVVALGLGGFSAVSSQAAQTVANTYLNCTTADGGTIVPSATKGATCNGVAGVANYVVLTGKSGGAKDYLVTVSGASATLSNASAAYSSNGFDIATGGLSAVAKADNTATIRVNTPAVGTITVSVYAATTQAGIYSSTAAETVVITVGATAQGGTFSTANSTVYLAKTETNTAVTADATVVAVASAGSKVATIQVLLQDVLGAVKNDTITATVSGPAYVKGQAGDGSLNVSLGTAYTDSVLSVTGTTATGYGAVNFVVGSNGQPGVAKITITNSANTVLATKSVTFSGKSATLTATTKVNYVANNGASKADVFSVVAKDSSGFPVTGVTPTVTVATADSTRFTSGSCASSDADGVSLCALTIPTTATEGALTVTFTASDVTTVTTTASTFISTVLASSLTITAAETAEAGSKVTYTLTAKNAAGNPVADGSYTFFASNSVNATLPGSNTLWSTTVTTVDGVATATAYAPSSSYTVTWTLAGTASTATTNLVAALAATTIPVTTTVTNAAQDAANAALDAAQEATDAANAAYDAANNAMDSADAATAAAQDAADNAAQALTAVVALSETVAKLVKQITAIAATLAKIQAKLKA